MIRTPSTTTTEYRGYPLLEYDGPGAGYFTAILDRLIEFMDGNAIPYFKNLNDANYLWRKTLCKFHAKHHLFCERLIYKSQTRYGGIPMNHGINVSRHNRAMQLEVFRVCSYIAKVNTKGSAALGCNDFHASKLPKEHKGNKGVFPVGNFCR